MLLVVLELVVELVRVSGSVRVRDRCRPPVISRFAQMPAMGHFST